jgi:hypothetical protein
MVYDEGQNELTERMLFGLPYRATCAEARRVYLQVIGSTPWREWSWRDDLLKSPAIAVYEDAAQTANQSAAQPVATVQWITREATDLYRDVARVTAKAIEEMEADR